MKKYLVIGNPIVHSLSPKLHNRWIKENNINAVYDKKQLNETDIQGIISEVKNSKIVWPKSGWLITKAKGINITKSGMIIFFSWLYLREWKIQKGVFSIKL